MARYVIDTRSVPVDFEIGDDLTKRTIQNARNLLRTRKGEVPYDRMRGFDTALPDRPLTQVMNALLPEVKRVLLWEPDAEVKRAWIEHDGAESVVCCEIEVNV